MLPAASGRSRGRGRRGRHSGRQLGRSPTAARAENGLTRAPGLRPTANWRRRVSGGLPIRAGSAMEGSCGGGSGDARERAWRSCVKPWKGAAAVVETMAAHHRAAPLAPGSPESSRRG